jgi:hypothetical protein
MAITWARCRKALIGWIAQKLDFLGGGDRLEGKKEVKSGFGARALRTCPAEPAWKKQVKGEIHSIQMQNPEEIRIEKQKEMARRIADLLARLHPEEQPLLRLELAHSLARRVMEHRGEMHAATGEAGLTAPGLTDTQPSDYEI